MIPLHLQTIFSLSLFDIFKTNNVYVDTLLTTLAFTMLNKIAGKLESYDFFTLFKYVNFDYCFRKCACIVLTGDRMRSVCEYTGGPIVSNTFSNTVNALGEYIIDNVDNNKTIQTITEISNPTDINRSSKKKQDYISYYVSQMGQFTVDEKLGIYGKTWSINESSDQKKKDVHVQRITIELFSYTCSLCEIKEFLKELTQKFVERIADERRDRRFIYEIGTLTSDEYNNGGWVEHEFKTTRSFDNMFFDGKSDFLKKVDFFVDNKNWYYDMGVPYTLGIGLYGPPGTGKTSLIKCLAKYLDRHVVTLSMKMFKTRKQLNEFYYEMRYNNANPKDSITFDKKIIVMEDIDCLGDIVLKRPDTEPIKLDRKGTLKVNELKNVEKEDANDNKLQTAMKNILVEDPITLDDILNIWDGVRETPGRVLIISSNHYDKLDPALTRPGRIDIAMEMSHASRQTIVQMYEHFFKCSLKPTQMKLIPDKKYTPAEVMNMYIRSSFSPEQFLKLLSQKSK